MKRLSIKTRMTLWYTLSMIFICIFTLCLVTLISTKVSDDSVKDKLKAVVKEIASEINSSESIDTLYNIEDSIDGICIAIYDDSGELISGIEPEGYENTTEFDNKETNTVIIGSKAYYIYDKKQNDIEDYDRVWVRGFLSVDGSTFGQDEMIKTAAIVIPIFIVIVAVTGYFIARRAFEPLREMNKAAESIAEGSDLSKRLPLSGRHDEIYETGITINDMLSRLERAFEDEKKFASDASHELRTPVAVILSQCEYFYASKQTHEEAREAIETINRQANRIAFCIKELLSMSRMERMAEGQDYEDVDLSVLADIVCDEQSELHEEKHINLIRDIEQGITYNGNQMMLLRAYTNILSNSYQYTYEYGNIKVSLHQEDDKIIYAVEDDGIGIDESDIDKIWNRFYQVEQSRSGNSNGSMGLGLSMVRLIVDYHKGKVSVDSVPGEGSCFKIILYT